MRLVLHAGRSVREARRRVFTRFDEVPVEAIIFDPDLVVIVFDLDDEAITTDPWFV